MPVDLKSNSNLRWIEIGDPQELRMHKMNFQNLKKPKTGSVRIAYMLLLEVTNLKNFRFDCGWRLEIALRDLLLLEYMNEAFAPDD
jgi:hypothetical protein